MLRNMETAYSPTQTYGLVLRRHFAHLWREFDDNFQLIYFWGNKSE